MSTTSLRCCAANAPAPAFLFIQLSMRRPLSTSAPILDLLVPCRKPAATSATTRRFLPSTPRPPAPTNLTSSKPWTASSTRQFSSHQTPSKKPSQVPRRGFSTSPVARATQTFFNPQFDEDGNEMKLEITPRAAIRLSQIMTKDSNPNLALRIQVESGGCHGFQYLMKLVTLPSSLPALNTASAEIREDDTIFTYSPDDEAATNANASGTTITTTDLTAVAPKIILDLPSLDLLKGSKVDFTMELIGSQFKIVDNPLATSSCGCGTSFDIKV